LERNLHLRADARQTAQTGHSRGSAALRCSVPKPTTGDGSIM